MKNHEKSKKHREMVVLLRQQLEEEDESLSMVTADRDGDEDEAEEEDEEAEQDDDSRQKWAMHQGPSKQDHYTEELPIINKIAYCEYIATSWICIEFALFLKGHFTYFSHLQD